MALLHSAALLIFANGLCIVLMSLGEHRGHFVNQISLFAQKISFSCTYGPAASLPANITVAPVPLVEQASNGLLGFGPF